MKKLLFGICIPFCFQSCQVQQVEDTEGAVAPEEKVVNVYTSRHYDADKAIYKEFEEVTGIRVNVKRGKDDQLIALLQSEDSLTQGDLLLTADVGRLAYAKQLGLYQVIQSDTLEKIVPSHLQDIDQQWFALTKRARIMVVDTAFSGRMPLRYRDVADSVYKGELLSRSSSNIYNQSLVASLIAHHGENEVREILQGWVLNFADNPSGNDRDQVKKIASGKGEIAFVNTYYLGKMATSKDEMEQNAMKAVHVFFPNQNEYGSHINISGGGVLKHAKHPNNARRLLEFLVSIHAQEQFAHANFEYPVRQGVGVHEVLESWGSFKEDTLQLSTIGDLNQQAKKLMKEAGWK